jgi:site-specific DNA recombinase
MEEGAKKKGIIYCRVSSLEQVDNTSLESQERFCRDYSIKNNIEILKTFIEKGESAKTADRTEFQKAISFCVDKKNQVDYFIVYKIDRFARNQEDHVTVQAILKKLRVSLRSVTEPISDSTMGKMMEGMLSVFAEFDNNVRTERSKGGMYENLKKGIWQWQAPLGYHRPIKGGNIAPEPSAAPFVRLMFEEYAKGIYTYLSLANYLSDRGFRTRTGKQICMQLVEKMLKNWLYCGKIKTWDLDVKGDFEAIVSEELFMQCQKGYRKAYLKSNRSIENPEFPLRRKCICDECNTSITGSKSKGKYPYYHHHKQGCPKAKFIPKETFEQLFVEYLNELTPEKKYENIFKAIVVDIWHNNYKKLNENNTKVRQELEKLEQERLKVFELHRAGIYSENEFLEQKGILNNKVYQKQRLLEDSHIEEFDMEEALNHCFNFVRETSKTWVRLKKSNYAHTMRFQNQIFPKKITFDGKKFGTDTLSLVYKMNQQSGANKSKLVTPPGIEPGLPA